MDLIDDQARYMLRHHGGQPNVKTLDSWATKIRNDLEKLGLSYLRVFDSIDNIIDGPPTPRLRR
jgi:phosphotransferase system IIB component